MKIKTRLFIFFALLIMAIIPTINYKAHSESRKEWRQWFDKTKLYNLDFALPKLSQLAYKFGISVSPKQVLIGSNDWLFIGDKYGQSLTKLRTGIADNDKVVAQKMGSAIHSWDQWLKSKNVEHYQVMLIADKQTVYSEFLPHWIQSAQNSFTDNLLAEVGHHLYIDTREILKNAKPQYKLPLYYKTDSHWNLLGGWVAYNELSRRFSKLAPNLNWLIEQNTQYGIGIPRGAGDLSSFLWLTDTHGEHEISVKLKQPFPIEVSKYALDTGIQSPYLEPLRYHYTTPPVMIHSKNALNDKKILFLVDSFGEYLSQYMTATFRDTLQIHYGSLNAASFALAVETFKPDYVVVAVVERDARTGIFLEFPTAFVLHNAKDNYHTQSKIEVDGLNHLRSSEKNNAYQVSGTDPYFHFKLLNKIKIKDLSKLAIDIQCNDATKHTPIQLFWATETTEMNESNSFRVNLKPGNNILDIATLNNNSTSDYLSSIRLDIDSAPGTCTNFNLNRIALVN